MQLESKTKSCQPRWKTPELERTFQESSQKSSRNHRQSRQYIEELVMLFKTIRNWQALSIEKQENLMTYFSDCAT